MFPNTDDGHGLLQSPCAWVSTMHLTFRKSNWQVQPQNVNQHVKKFKKIPFHLIENLGLTTDS